jgi:pullulanase/glycogen debranching enzyme
MARAADGVWEAAREGLDVGRHYAFRVDGPAGAGEGFDAGAPVGDPYALAAAHAHGLPLVIDPAATNAWFPGGPPDGFRAPAATDLVIYEAHVRDLTSDPSSGVAPALRGTYPGLTASAGTGAALDHLAALGVNAIQFLPVAEFGNGTNDHGWGYNTVYFFAPEASYGTDPLRGSAYHEFKQLVRELHRRGFAVILDVVYNHVGEPNLFHRIDRPYYFRLDPDLGYRNASGCGNEFRSEAPMARRLIVDNVRYWMREHGVDGFRFDLAELIDLETLMAVRDAARELNPNVILISEPWSLRGDHKRALRGTGWAAWNNEFRDPAKHFALGRGDRDRLVKAVAGSVATWTAEPRQSVNYLESHDDSALADELSGRPDRDGRVPTEEAAARNRLAATLLFTSLGIPMIGEGQEFLRSKGGRHNTFAGGDAVNALRWADRQQPLAAEALAYYAGLIRLRRSPAGASLRLGDAPPPGYVEWILPPGETALGYAINGRRERPGAAFVVLANAGDAPFAFDVNWPPGAWRQVGDGRRIRPEGLDPDRGSAAPQRDRDGGGSPGRDRAPTGTEGGRPDGTGLPPPPFGLRRASPPPPFGLRRASPPSPFGPRWASPRVAEQGGRVVVPPRSAWVFMAD